MLRLSLLIASLMGASSAAVAQDQQLPYQIHSIASVDKIGDGSYAFETQEGQVFEVAASDAGIAHDLMRQDAFSQDYHCAMQPLTDDMYHIVGCSGVGVPGPLRLP